MAAGQGPRRLDCAGLGLNRRGEGKKEKSQRGRGMIRRMGMGTYLLPTCRD